MLVTFFALTFHPKQFGHYMQVVYAAHGLHAICKPLLLPRYTQQPLALQVLHNLLDAILYALQVTPDVNLRLLRRLIWRTNTRELWNLALPRLLIQTLWIARLRDLERNVDEDLDESERFF
jgi:hypothetical protein